MLWVCVIDLETFGVDLLLFALFGCVGYWCWLLDLRLFVVACWIDTLYGFVLGVLGLYDCVLAWVL